MIKPILPEGERKRRIAELVEHYQGILPYFEAFFLQSIIYAADQSLVAFYRFDDALKKGGKPEEIFAAIQDALSHASALSRFFWPARSKDILHIARAEKLKASFQILESSALKQRGLRNAFEHFDERLDEFLLNDPSGFMLPTPLVTSSDISEDPLGHIFKLVDPDKGIIVLLGEKYDYPPIRNEVMRILYLAIAMDNDGSRLMSKR